MMQHSRGRLKIVHRDSGQYRHYHAPADEFSDQCFLKQLHGKLNAIG